MNIVFNDSYGGKSAEINVYYSTESATIEVRRSSDTIKRVKILKTPSWIGRLRNGFYGLGSMTDQQVFERYITETISEYTRIAKEYVKKDDLQNEKIVADKKTEQEKTDEMRRFMEKIKTEVEKENPEVKIIHG